MDAVVLGISPNGLSAARSLGRTGLRVVMAETAIDPAIASSRYIERCVLLPDDDDAIVELLLAEAGSGSKPFLLPTGDRYALLMARHQARLATKYRFVTAEFDALTRIVDKAILYETAASHGIVTPIFAVVQRREDIEPALERVPTPCYVKPALGHVWRKTHRGKVELATTRDELRRVLEGFVREGLVAVPQEIIPGKDSDIYALSAYVDQSGQCVGWRTKRKLRQWPVDAGDGSLQEICDSPEVVEVGQRLLEITGHRGPATIEFRRDVRDGRLVLIEINVRTVSGQEMMVRSGLDVVRMAWQDATGQTVTPPGPVEPTRWINFQMDFRAFRVMRNRGELTLLQWLRSIKGCTACAYYASDDPAPFYAAFRGWVASAIRKQTTR